MKNNVRGFSLLEFMLSLMIFSVCLVVVIHLKTLKQQKYIQLEEEKILHTYIDAFEWFLQNNQEVKGIWWSYHDAITKERYFKKDFDPSATFKISVKKDSSNLYYIQFFSLIQKKCLITYVLRLTN